ncbi:MAG: hypothetical protein H0X29_00280 [Parachlamydiaceae bacterium]|nr:hypothetical protein [Parachlamydiaceae bacterium]
MSKCFPSDKVICLGTQLILIIKTLKEFLAPHIWYGADIEAVGIGAMKNDLNNIQLNPTGTDSEFIQYCSGIDQFIWGVFLCIDANLSSQNIQIVELETEDEPFRSISWNGVLLEIRAFDTSHFEIYSEDIKTIEMISKKFSSSEITLKNL